MKGEQQMELDSVQSCSELSRLDLKHLTHPNPQFHIKSIEKQSFPTFGE